jgi:hypothetical protein
MSLLSSGRQYSCVSRRIASIALASIAVFAGLFMVPGRADAQITWVVSPTGNDANPGTSWQPFRTIQKAADVVNPGDTVIVEDGTYTGTGTGTACASASKPIVCLTRGGVDGLPVTFRAQNVGGAKLDGQNNTSTDGFRFVSNANYIVIDGFEIFGMGNASGSSSGLELYSAGHDVVITRNHIHNIGRMCTETSNGEVGIFIEQPRVHVEGNRIHDIGRYVSGENGCSTTYQGSRDHGIYVDGSGSGSSIPGASSILISNNLFYNNVRGWSIQVYPGSVDALSVLDNTFAFANPYQDGHIILGANISNSRLMNNVFYSPRNVAIDYYTGTETNLEITNNLVFNASLLNTLPAGATVLSNVAGDPQLVNTSTAPYDFHLTSTSPAINRGVDLTDVTADFDSNARVSPYDIGAYEYGAAPGDTTAPTVSITAPANGARVTGRTPISASASDDVGVVSVRFLVDGSAIATDTSAPYSTVFNFRKVSAGSHTIAAIATDAAGNTATASITVMR